MGSKARLRKVSPADIQHFSRARILVIGDVMLDHFVWGNVRRISPEAPVPVVEVVRETLFPGGAANVARNLAEFTKHSFIMGRIGRDSAAQQLTDLLNSEGVSTDTLMQARNITHSMEFLMMTRPPRR